MRTPHDPLLRAWYWLLALSIATTGLAAAVGAGAPPAIAGAVILTLAYLKARLILNRYLGLDAAPFWKRGFELVLAVWAALLLLLYLVPELRGPLRVERGGEFGGQIEFAGDPRPAPR